MGQYHINWLMYNVLGYLRVNKLVVNPLTNDDIIDSIAMVVVPSFLDTTILIINNQFQKK